MASRQQQQPCRQHVQQPGHVRIHDHHRRILSLQRLLLLVVLLAMANFRSAAAGDAFDTSQCPAWLQQYEQWHVKNRAAEGAKYLIADAPGFVGVGDHLRGFMYALRVAAATNRVLLLRWEHPGNLTDFLVPCSSINWTWDGTPAQALLAADKNLKTSDEQKDVFMNNDLGKAFPEANFFSHELSNKTFLVLKTNFPAESRCVICPSVLGKPAESYDFVCLFRYLFKPSALVQQTTDEYLRTLYPGYSPNSSSSFDYQAVHLRLGHMRGEESVVNCISGYVDPLAKFLLSVGCGSGLAAESGIDIKSTPLLLLADHRGVRQFSRHGRLLNVVTPAYDAVHTKMNSVEAHLLSFVDLNLIARAKCAVLSHSGFSNVGWWMSGGNSCRMMLSECYKVCARNSTSPYCA